MKADYIKATLARIEAGDDPKDVVRGLRLSMEARHHERLFDVVLRNVLKVLERQAPTTSVRVANEKHYKAAQNTIKTTLKELGTEDTPAIILDESLIGGYIAEHDGTYVDKSYKYALTNLYRRITNR